MKALLTLAVLLLAVPNALAQEKSAVQSTVAQNAQTKMVASDIIIDGKTVVCAMPECFRRSKAAASNLTDEQALREICLADDLTWREEGITYVGLPADTPRCFRAEWHTFTYGGPQ